MAVETLTISLSNTQKIKGSNLISGDVDDNQIVTVLDGGNLSGRTYEFEKWGKDTPTEPGAGPGGDDEFYFDLSGFDDNFDIEIKSFDPLDCFIFTNFDSYSVVGNVWTFDYTGSDGQPHTVSIDAESTNGTGVACIVVCFAKGTKIRVPAGQMAIEDLQVGDMVHCGDGMQRPILWIGSRAIDQQTLDLHPELRPVQIKTGALEPGYPARDLYLSPQHRVLLRDWRAELLFGEDEVLATASSLINDSTIRPDMECTQVEYFHLLLDGHQTVFANGVECETLMPAEMAQNALPAEARTEICAIFPELATDLGSFGPLYRMALKPTEIRAMMAL